MRILVFQHLAIEHPGILADYWRAAGHELQTVELDEGDSIPPLEGFDMMVAMGGPMDVWQEDRHPWFVPEKAAIRKWVRDMERPFLGICLGHQLLADALGGTVGLMKRPEVGLVEVELTEAGRRDPIFAGIPEVLPTLQWHGAEITQLPDGGEILATNSVSQVQAMRCGRLAYGFQCHMEISDTTVDEWAKVPEYKASLERTLGLEDAARLAETVGKELPAFHRTAWRLNENFMGLIGG
jgi:GMP synthase-like glutamine amidotransferase